MTPRPVALRVEEARPGRGQDRATVVEVPHHTLVVVADGAGGVAGGAAAADEVCRVLAGDADWATWLGQRDVDVAARGTGMAAAIALSISDDGDVRGASVGDCEAWVFTDGGAVDLTGAQVRKPLLGEGAAVPTSFVAAGLRGTLVVATDGLWKYLSGTRIAKLARTRPLEAAVAALVDSVRLRSGALQDDVAIVMCALHDT